MDKIKLINHSSIFISNEEIGILTDPGMMDLRLMMDGLYYIKIKTKILIIF